MEKDYNISALEAILFASGEPMPAERIALVLGVEEDAVHRAAARLSEQYRAAERGIRLVRLNNAYQLHSAPEFSEQITRILEQRRPQKLSPASMEVLAIVAYYQPVTRAYIEKMRGVDSSYTVSALVNRGLIEPCGQLEVIGRPTVFRTTDLFLRTAGISRLEDLPELKETSGNEAVQELEKKVQQLQQSGDSAPEN